MLQEMQVHKHIVLYGMNRWTQKHDQQLKLTDLAADPRFQ